MSRWDNRTHTDLNPSEVEQWVDEGKRGMENTRSC